MTLRLSSACSNQLSYRPVRTDIVALGSRLFRRRVLSAGGVSRQFGTARRAAPTLEARGFEPLTSSLQSWRSTN
jgi:hypothetical protein